MLAALFVVAPGAASAAVTVKGSDTMVILAQRWAEDRFNTLGVETTVAKDGVTLAIGAGQMSRVDSVKICERKAGDKLKGGVVASDAFFPFRDGVDVLAEAGAVAVVQPGGSVRDDEVIGAADEHGLAMLFTGMRHFRH